MSAEATQTKIQTSLAPWLLVRGSEQAVEFYKAAFGAVEVYRMEVPGGGVASRLSVGGSQFWTSDESPEHFNFSPKTLGGPTARMILIVPDPEALFAQALKAGASQVYPVGEQFGWRVGRVVDPFGHFRGIIRALLSVCTYSGQIP